MLVSFHAPVRVIGLPLFMISGFRVLISGIYASPILVIFIDMIYQFLCIGEFVCH